MNIRYFHLRTMPLRESYDNASCAVASKSHPGHGDVGKAKVDYREKTSINHAEYTYTHFNIHECVGTTILPLASIPLASLRA